MSEFEYLADVGDLPDGTLLGVRRSDGDYGVSLQRRGHDGAVGNICTHAEFLMSDGTLLNTG